MCVKIIWKITDITLNLCSANIITGISPRPVIEARPCLVLGTEAELAFVVAPASGQVERRVITPKQTTD